MSIAKKLIQAAAGVGGGAAPTDPNFSDTTLLLQGDTSNESMLYNAFGDASTNAHDITPVGGVYGTPFSPYNESWSVEFDGTGDYLSVSSDTSLAMGTGDFTAECWVYRPVTGRGTFFDTRPSNNALGFLVQADSNNKLALFTDADYRIVDSGDSLPVGEWFHVALVRSGSTTTLYKNGTSVGTYSDSNNYSAGVLTVGSNFGISSPINGSISNLRIVKGTALYTSTFTPSTTPLTDVSGTGILTCNANRFIDTSSNAHTITVNGDPEIKGFSPFADTDTVTGSGYFDGSTTSYLYPSDSSDYNFGTGDFTVECWFWAERTANTQGLIGFRPNTTNGSYLTLQFTTGNAIGLYNDTAGGFMITTSAISTHQWYHIAVCRNSGTTTMYLNGVSQGSFSDSTTYATGANRPRIGANDYLATPTGDALWDGYISNVRIVKGTAVYTSAFNPPTDPLTDITNTELLTLQNRGANRNIGFIDSSHPTREITRNGNVTQGSFSPFSQDEGNWSVYFDGSGDYLRLPTSNDFDFPSGTDFTLECWVYCTSLATSNVFLATCANLANNQGIYFGTSGSNVIFFEYLTNTTLISSAFTPNQWNHVAACRAGSTLTLYLNGASVGTASDTRNYAGDSANGGIGGFFSNPATAYLNGYMKDLRVVKGTAVYTSAFTPPTAPLTNITNTVLLTCQSNRFVDNSSNAHSITVNGDTKVVPFSPFAPSTAYDPATKGGSGYFDGVGDYLESTSTDYELGAGDFTVEGWVWPSSIPNGVFHMTSAVPSNSTSGLALISSTATDNPWTVYFDGVNTTTSIPTLNTWQHFALVRNGATLTLYIDGTSVFTKSVSTTSLTSTDTLVVGMAYSSSFTWDGYISNFRVVKGTAVYTANFTPPTAPLSTVSGTELLCNFTNAGIYDGTGRNVLETVGDAHVENSVKKYGTGSMQFDETGDYLKVPPTDNIAFGTGDFTIECWARFATSASGNGQGLFQISNGYLNSAVRGPAVGGDNATGRWAIYYGTSQATHGSLGPSVDTWYHVAYVRNSGTTKLYIDGTEIISVSDSANYTDTYLSIAGWYNTGYLLNGYIDDLRITKGVARYTANFTPPAAKLPNL